MVGVWWGGVSGCVLFYCMQHQSFMLSYVHHVTSLACTAPLLLLINQCFVISMYTVYTHSLLHM